MVLRQMVVDAVVLEGRSIREVARSFGVSKSWVYELVRRYREGGERALEERSKAHHTNPRQMSAATEEELLRLRKELLDLGADHGAATLQWHLAQREDTTPSVSAIYRMLKRRGFIARTSHVCAAGWPTACASAKCRFPRRTRLQPWTNRACTTPRFPMTQSRDSTRIPVSG